AKDFHIITVKKYFPELCEAINNNNFRNKKELENQKREEIKRNLLVALDIEPPISLYQFSKDFGIGEYNAKNYCPELAMKITIRYRSYVEKRKKNRTEKIKSEIKQVVLELHNSGIYPGDKSMRTKLTNPNCLIDPEIRRVWKKELELLGYKK
ncbi:MAG: hypothetical protein AB2392_11465, partial [Neobacillus sp.]